MDREEGGRFQNYRDRSVSAEMGDISSLRGWQTFECLPQGHGDLLCLLKIQSDRYLDIKANPRYGDRSDMILRDKSQVRPSHSFS